MKTVSQHIEHIKSKPHHVRKRVAFGAAFAGTAFIALVWLVSSVGTGAFALKNTSFADSIGQGNSVVTEESSNTSAVAGASAGLETNKDMPARIEIIDTASSTRQSKKAEQTTIPF
ncbi:MAG: hypothetical protein AAB517_02450 [Patescibacteria group bacterium]